MSKTNRKLILALAGALIVTFLCGSGLFQRPDLWAQDALFQRPRSVPGDIVVIGIEKSDLDAFGPYNSWDRTILASALEALAQDPANKPAVVAVDVMFTGHTTPEADQRLVDAAAALNMVTACTAEMGIKRTFGVKSVIEDPFAVVGFEEPFEELKKVTTEGHINAMLDDDGVLRHAQLYVEPESGRVYSMAYECARLYAEQKGITITEPPVNARGQFYVDFSAKPMDFYDGISVSKLISGDLPSNYFAGKLVLIGPHAAALQDSFITAIDQSEHMYGVEYQANVIQCILDGNYKESAPDYIQLIVLGLVSFAFFYFTNERRLRVTVPILIVFSLLGIAASLLLYSAGTITHAVWIPLSVLILFIFNVAGSYVHAAIERQNVTKTFERYVAPSIVGEILKEGTDSLKLGGKLCDIAVLFVDIRGFTTMSERLSPEEVVNILNQYLTMTSSCIEKNKGTLDKFVGDATMAFWGAPLPEEDPVMRAAKTALDIVDGAKALSKKLKEEINEELNVGVGVHFGPAVVGNMGSEKRMDYTAIGDTVNTAARLEANAPGGTVYISRAVADKLEGRMDFESLGASIKLKGKAEGFEVLKLLGPKE